MADFVNVPLGYNIPSQIPLDVKTYVQNEATLKNLGFGNTKVFTYYKGLIFYCIDEGVRYEWLEVDLINDGKGLMTTNYQYPANHVAFGITYSNKYYNFFKVDNTITIDGSETKLVAGSNVTISGSGTIASPYNIASTAVAGNTQLVNGTNTIITGNGTVPTPYRVNVTFPTPPTPPDGSETRIQPGSNINVAGIGTIASPYVISGPAPTPPTILNSGNNTTISGAGITGDPYRVNVTFPTPPPTPDGSETKIVAGINVSVSGNGTVSTPYNISSTPVATIQKTISSNYTLVSSDNDNIIFINNGTFNVTITVPSNLSTNFNCGFIQQGTGLVTFITSFPTLLSASGLKIKGQYDNAYIVKYENTETYYLLGNLKT